MSIEIGKGLDPKERNALVDQTIEFLERHEESIYGKDVVLEPKYVGLLKSGNRVTREAAVLEGIFQSVEDYEKFISDVEEFREEIKKTPGFMIMRYSFYEDKKIEGFRSFGFIGSYEREQFPTTVRSKIKFISGSDIEYSEMLPSFEDGIKILAEKYDLSCSFIDS